MPEDSDDVKWNYMAGAATTKACPDRHRQWPGIHGQ